MVSDGFLTLSLLSFGHFFIDLYSSALGAFQPVLVPKLHLSLREAGILGGTLIFCSSVMQPLYGYWSDRLRSRLFTVLAPAVAGLFICMLGVAPNYAAALLFVALGGAGIASFHPQATAWATVGISSNRSRWMAIFISAGTLGMASGPSVFSTVLSRFGAEATRWIAIPGLLATLILTFRLPASTGLAQRTSHAVDWQALRRYQKPLLILYFLVFIRSIIQITYAQFLPLYLSRERGFGLDQANYALSAYLASGALGGFVGGNLADRFGGRSIILWSMIGSVAPLALFFMLPGWPSILFLALGGLILLFTIPVNVVMAQQLVPSEAGTISALMMGFSWGMAGLFFIPMTGWLSDSFTLHKVLFGLLVFPLIGFFLALQLDRDRLLKEHP
jgi:MFS transporter, FSR family, fosmidomycin resistance protein